MRLDGKQLPLVTVLTLSLALLTGCGGFSSKESEGDLSRIQKAINQVVPSCKLETFEVPNGTLSIKDDDYRRISVLTTRLVESDLVYVKDENGETDMWKPPTGEKYVNPSKDKFYVCNSNGTSFSEVDDYEDVLGKYLPDGFSCWIPNPDLAKENLKSLKICEKRLDEISKLGFWIGIREGSSSQEIQKAIIPIAEGARVFVDYPIAFHENYAITLLANFDDVNLATIQNIDSSWKRLVKLLDLDLISNYVSKFPKKFQQDSQENFRDASSDGRLMINLGYSRSLSALSCSETLSLSEVNYSAGECGKLEFEVFQSDLNTGNCTFLGYWNDSNGNQKIGVVNFCTRFDSGSFSEGRIYTLKVKVDGSTSYRTKLGYENNVLSFSAI